MNGEPFRGFESHPLRHKNVGLRIANCELRIWNLEFEISGSSERDPNQNDQLKQKEDGSV